jgi:hypothetical protein
MICNEHLQFLAGFTFNVDKIKVYVSYVIVKESYWRRNYVVIYKVVVQRRKHHFVRKAWVWALSGLRRPRSRGVKRSAEQQGLDSLLLCPWDARQLTSFSAVCNCKVRLLEHYVVCDTTPCQWVNSDGLYGEAFCSNLQGFSTELCAEDRRNNVLCNVSDYLLTSSRPRRLNL